MIQLGDYVERGALPGLIALGARGDDVRVDVLGSMSFDDPEPMPRDAIFRIASLTKPVTAAAAMILVDDGVVRLEDPVDDLLPELADRRVLRSMQSDLDDTALQLRTLGPPWRPTSLAPDEWIVAFATLPLMRIVSTV